MFKAHDLAGLNGTAQLLELVRKRYDELIGIGYGPIVREEHRLANLRGYRRFEVANGVAAKDFISKAKSVENFDMFVVGSELGLVGVDAEATLGGNHVPEAGLVE